MRAIVQRVGRAEVVVDGATVGRIDKGLLVFVGIGQGDDERDVKYLADKIRFLRVFPDAADKMNLDVAQVEGAVLVISNFTLFADVRQGRRPAFTEAAPPEIAAPLYEKLADRLVELGLTAARGRFGARMQVTCENAGPVNILLDSKGLF